MEYYENIKFLFYFNLLKRYIVTKHFLAKLIIVKDRIGKNYIGISTLG